MASVNKKILFVATTILLLDQITKTIVETYVKVNSRIKVIKDFFYITLCHNEGAAWGILSGYKIIIILFTILAICLIYHFIFCFKRNKRNEFAFGLLVGGLAGNLIDRILFGYVRDFFDFYIFQYDYPVFNVADIAIVLGVGLLAIAIFKGEDLSENRNKRGRKNKTRQISSEDNGNIKSNN